MKTESMSNTAHHYPYTMAVIPMEVMCSPNRATLHQKAWDSLNFLIVMKAIYSSCRFAITQGIYSYQVIIGYPICSFPGC